MKVTSVVSLNCSSVLHRMGRGAEMNLEEMSTMCVKYCARLSLNIFREQIPFLGTCLCCNGVEDSRSQFCVFIA